MSPDSLQWTASTPQEWNSHYLSHVLLNTIWNHLLLKMVFNNFKQLCCAWGLFASGLKCAIMSSAFPALEFSSLSESHPREEMEEGDLPLQMRVSLCIKCGMHPSLKIPSLHCCRHFSACLDFEFKLMEGISTSTSWEEIGVGIRIGY